MQPRVPVSFGGIGDRSVRISDPLTEAMPCPLLRPFLVNSLLWGLVFSGTVAAQPSTKTISDTVALNRTGAVEIENQRGSIRITTWDRAQVGYEIALESPDQDSVFLSDLDLEHSDQQFSAEPDEPWSLRIPGILTIAPGGTESPIVHYRITMPNTADLDIDDYGSTIDVEDVEANLELETYQGEATLDAVTGFLTLETYQGTITATDIRGGVDAETYQGTLSVSFDRFSTESSVETYSGSLRLFLPAETAFALSTDLVSTTLSVDEAFGSPTTRDETRIFNGGGSTLEIEAYSGTVDVRSHKSTDRSPPP